MGLRRASPRRFELGIVDELGEPATRGRARDRGSTSSRSWSPTSSACSSRSGRSRAGRRRALRGDRRRSRRSERAALGRVTAPVSAATSCRRARRSAGPAPARWRPAGTTSTPTCSSPRGRPPACSGSPPSTCCRRSTGCAESLERPGASFLDVGAGIGVISAELCAGLPGGRCRMPGAQRRGAPDRPRTVPEPRASGRGSTSSPHGVEELDAAERYDLAIVPQPFLSRSPSTGRPGRVEAGAAAGRVAARAGARRARGRSAARSAASRVRARLWGGGAVGPPASCRPARPAGFDGARANPPVGGYRMFAGRRCRDPRRGAGRPTSPRLRSTVRAWIRPGP